MRQRNLGVWVLGAALLVAGCSNDSDNDTFSTSTARVTPKTRYDLANDCFALQSVAAKAFAVREGAGYAATSAALAGAEPFFMKPTALGEYLFHAKDKTLLTVSGAEVGTAGGPSDSAVWTIDTNAAGLFTVASESAGKALATDSAGRLVLADAPGAFRFVPASGCTPYPELDVGIVGDTYKGRGVSQPAIGFAEVHTHMAMGHEMSDGSRTVGPSAGGALYGQMFHRFGVPHALEDCAAWHGPDGIRDPEATVLDLTPLALHDTQGWPSFIDWPASDSQLHQAMYYKWVERAWKAGLRILVSEGTNIEALCEVARIYMTTVRPDALGFECRDMDLGIGQVKYLFELQDYVDAQEGGPGKGWFRIVKDPTEARRVINEGKLAVVPGLEFANLFRCNVRFVAGNEIRGCTTEDIDRQIDEVWDLGVRELFPYHDVNSALGGTGIFNGDVLNLVGFYGTLEFWKTYDCPDGGEGDSYFYDAGSRMTTAVPGTGSDPLTSAVLDLLGSTGLVPLYPPDRRQCNARGTTDLGQYALQKLMEKRFIIDIDHAELSIKQDMIDLAKAQNPPYPLISAHGGHGGISMQQAREILELGGLIYPFKPNGKGHVEFIEKLKLIWQAARPGEPLAVGYGMDANGIANRAGPRGAGSEPVVYPFTLFQGPGWGPQFVGIKPVTFNLQTVPESGKSWNIDEVGTAHYGMVADYVEEVRLEGGREALDALYNSAEAYLQMWERTVNR